jgi:histidinol-phosphate/aromatic aminotransferase/cobyric acid decarboxylase-like protein
MLSDKKDYVALSKAGLNIIALGAIDKREAKDEKGGERMVHSLESVNYLKVNKGNFVLFECADEDRVISIQQEFEKQGL